MKESVGMATKMISQNQRLSIVTILLATIAFLLVITSVIAFLYVTRKGMLSYFLSKLCWKKDKF